MLGGSLGGAGLSWPARCGNDSPVGHVSVRDIFFDSSINPYINKHQQVEMRLGSAGDCGNVAPDSVLSRWPLSSSRTITVSRCFWSTF